MMYTFLSAKSMVLLAISIVLLAISRILLTMPPVQWVNPISTYNMCGVRCVVYRYLVQCTPYRVHILCAVSTVSNVVVCNSVDMHDQS